MSQLHFICEILFQSIPWYKSKYGKNVIDEYIHVTHKYYLITLSPFFQYQIHFSHYALCTLHGILS